MFQYYLSLCLCGCLSFCGEMVKEDEGCLKWLKMARAFPAISDFSGDLAIRRNFALVCI